MVAGLDLRTGNIAWRQVLPVGESVAILRAHGKGLLSVSVASHADNPLRSTGLRARNARTMSRWIRARTVTGYWSTR